ncbi:MAG: glycosyltransferase family 4 protein [Chthoniobacterales bacterium]
MPDVAYLFERFPSFGQTFCYREVVELERQGARVRVFSIRRPTDEPRQDWDQRLVDRVHYLPEEKVLVPEIDRAIKKGAVSSGMRGAIQSWDRQPDFLRLYQAVHVGRHMEEAGLRHVHAHFAGMAARTAYWIREFFGTTYSFTAHANDIFSPREFTVSLAKLISNAASVVTVSDYAVDLLKQKFPESAAKICRVYNGIELSRFPAAEPDAEKPSIISVGRLIEKKGFADLIDACGILKAKRHDFRCTIIGDGPLEEALQSRITKAGLLDCVELTGPLPQPEIASRLARATLFALPCIREADGAMDNLPTVIMEAMAAGLPVVSTPLAGIPEMVKPGINGDLVPERDPNMLANAIAALLTNRERAREFGVRGREIAAEKFSIETNVRQLREIFTRIPARTSSRVDKPDADRPA